MAILHYHLPRHQGTGPLRKSFRPQLFHPLHGITLQHRATRATRAASVHQRLLYGLSQFLPPNPWVKMGISINGAWKIHL